MAVKIHGPSTALYLSIRLMMNHQHQPSHHHLILPHSGAGGVNLGLSVAGMMPPMSTTIQYPPPVIMQNPAAMAVHKQQHKGNTSTPHDGVGDYAGAPCRTGKVAKYGEFQNSTPPSTKSQMDHRLGIPPPLLYNSHLGWLIGSVLVAYRGSPCTTDNI